MTETKKLHSSFMTDISLDLVGKVADDKIRVLRDIARTSEHFGIAFFIVGAFAREMIMEIHHELPAHRATTDIDLGVRVETWDRFNQLKQYLVEKLAYRYDANQVQRLHSLNGDIVDIVPFGGVEERNTRNILWPPDHTIEMDTFGFEEAYHHALKVSITPDIVVKIGSLAGLALMKLVAWQQRRLVKDAKDLQNIARKYLDAGNMDRLYTQPHSDLLEDENFIDRESAGFRLLGRDIANLVSIEQSIIVLKILTDPTSLAANISYREFDPDEAFEKALSLLKGISLGIEDILRI